MIVVAAAGNQGTLGSSAIVRHPWVVPVAACDLRGVPLSASNLAGSIGRRGLCAPGDRIISIAPERRTLMLSGTSFAAPFVTGTAALLWSAFPAATAAEVKAALTRAVVGRRATVVPLLLDASASYGALAASYPRGEWRS